MKTIRALSLLFVLAVPAFGGIIINPSEPQPPPAEPMTASAIIVAVVAPVVIVAALP